MKYSEEIKMNKLALLLIAVLLIVVCIAIVNANEEQGREKLANRLNYSTTVELRIGGNEEIKNAVYSYVSRELRSLRDVRVVKDNGDWVIDLVALQDENTLGQQIGVTLSVVVLERFRLRLYNSLLVKGKLNEKAKLSEKANEYKLLEIITSNLYRIIAHRVQIGGPNDLQYLCQETVANFDARHLKPEREFRQEMIDKDIESLKKENPE